MAGNSFGTLFKLSTFGESHGAAIGAVIDGCPAGVNIDTAFLQSELNRRRPGQSSITTGRNEQDEVEILSGVFEGQSTGTPIGFIIRNKDQKSEDYAAWKDTFRPSHADFTYEKKFGRRDHRGGGRSSARETACRVVAGAIAKLILQSYQITIHAFVKQVAHIGTSHNFNTLDLSKTESNPVRCPDTAVANDMIRYIETLKAEGDSAGGIIQCVILNLPPGLGEPVFDKFHATLAHAMMSINAVKGFELGSGFESVKFKGSELNDEFEEHNGTIVTKTNHSGGVQGGITNGMPVYFNVAFKPVASIQKTQSTVNRDGQEVTISGRGRHDPCVLPRAVPIVESMAALVAVDQLFLSRSNRI